LIFSEFALAKTYTLRLQCAYPKRFPVGQCTQYFADRVESLTKGNVKIKIFEPGQLAKSTEAFDALRKSMVDMYSGSMLYFSGDVPEVNCEWLPYSWANSMDVIKVYQDYGWLKLLDQATMKHGIHYVAPVSVATMGLMTSFRIRRLEDLKGRKIRAVGMEGMIVDSLGGLPVSLAAPEQYIALKRGLVDGTDFPWYTIARWKFYEVCKYVSAPALHSPGIVEILINNKVFESLPKDYQAAIDRAGWEAFLYSLVSGDALDIEAKKACNQHGVEIIRLDAKEVSRFRDATLPLWEKMEDRTEISGKMVRNLRKFLKASRKKAK